MFPTVNSWVPLKDRLARFQIVDPDNPPDPDEMYIRIDMRDGNSIVKLKSCPTPSVLTQQLTRSPPLLSEYAQQVLLELEELATQLMRGVDKPWVWFHHQECKYIDVFINPATGNILYLKNNYGAFTTLIKIREQ